MLIRILSFAVFCLLLGCATSSTFEHLSGACEKSDIPSCFRAAEYVWKLRTSDLKPCLPQEDLCIKPGESTVQAKARLDAKSIEQNGKACDLGKNAEACLRAGSTLAIMSSEMPIGEYKDVAAKAEAFFNKACRLGLQAGCQLQGTTNRADD